MKLNWKNPKKELPNKGKLVAVMIEPHKFKDSIKDSLKSSVIYFGTASVLGDGSCRIDNDDELGRGGISWSFDDSPYEEDKAVAWAYIDERGLPNFIKR